MPNERTNVIPKRIKCDNYSAENYTAYINQVGQYTNEDRDSNFSADIELNDMEKELDKLMSSVREKAVNNKYVYLVDMPQIEMPQSEEPEEYYPIHPFNEVKEKIEKSGLYGTFQRMPKGGNLHIHTSAALGTEKFISLLKEFNGKKDWKVFVWKNPKGVKQDGKNVLYDGTLFLIKSEYEQYLKPKIRKHLEGFAKCSDNELKSYYSFMNAEATKDVKYIWDEFNKIFSRVSKILLVKDFYTEYYMRAFQELADDNVDYVELRFGMSKLNDGTWSEMCCNVPSGLSDKSGWKTWDAIEVIWDVYQEFIKNNKDFKLKLIISGSRRKKEGENIDESINKALEETHRWMNYKKNNFVIGYDLVSEEDRGHSTDDYAKAIYASQYSKDIPFYFHDGESCWADDTNLYAAVSLGTKRVGHGLNLFRFPSLVKAIKEHNVALEVCPISNQLLRYTLDLRMHLIGEYMNRGVECVVCSDDPTILGNGGLSYDFWEVYYSQLLGLKEIKKLIINSYMYSGMTDKEYEKKIEKWEEKWNRFVEEEIAILQGIKI